MEKYQLKPFSRVLVRDIDEQPWKCGIFSHYNEHEELKYECAGSVYKQCIPYNENTAHLLGTTKPYEEPEPKVWYVTDLNAKSTCTMTQKQFEHFMKDILGSNVDGGYQIGKIKK